MNTSDKLALWAIMISIGTFFWTIVVFFWNKQQEKKRRIEKSLVDLAITYRTKFTLGVAGKFEISLAIHNIGNANAVVNRIFITEKLQNGNYKNLEELNLDIKSQRIIKSGDSCTYEFKISSPYFQNLDVLLSNQSAFLRVMEAKGRVFDSSRN